MRRKSCECSGLGKLARGLAFVRAEELTDEERRKNADAQAKAAMLSGMIRNPKLPPPKNRAADGP